MVCMQKKNGSTSQELIILAMGKMGKRLYLHNLVIIPLCCLVNMARSFSYKDLTLSQ